MSNLPLSFSLSEIPATLAYNFSALSGAITATFSPPADNRLYVVRGIDTFATQIVGFIDMYYNINGTGQMPFAHSENIDPLDTHVVLGTWRGAIAVAGGGHFAAAVDALGVPTDMGVVIWGSVMPIGFPGYF